MLPCPLFYIGQVFHFYFDQKLNLGEHLMYWWHQDEKVHVTVLLCLLNDHVINCLNDLVCQVVVLIGSSASAVDISCEIAELAKEVHIASRSAKKVVLGLAQGYGNIWLHPMVNLLLIL